MRIGCRPNYRAAASVALFFIFLTSIPAVRAGWSTGPNRINYYINPDWDNARTVYFGNTSFTVQAIQYGWTTTQIFLLHVRNDNYAHDVKLKWKIHGIIHGPAPTSDWIANGWVGFARWDNIESRWVSPGAADGVIHEDVDPGENFLARIAFNFQDQKVFNAGPWFPGNLKVQLRLYNLDNNETYYTPILNWWCWEYQLENIYVLTSDDTWVNADNSGANYWKDNLLLIRTITNGADDDAGVQYKRRTYVKLPLTMPSTWGIQRAWLKYYIDRAYTSHSGYPPKLRLRYTATTWTENMLTWANRNTYALVEGSLSDDIPASIGWNTFDVSSFIRDKFIAGASAVSFMLDSWRSTPGLAVTLEYDIRSKEYGDGSFAPQLIVELAPMAVGDPPKFELLTPMISARRISMDLMKWEYNLILRGHVSSMGDEAAINFDFIGRKEPDKSWKIWSYPAAVSTPGTFFSITTTGFEFVEKKTYWFRLRGYGVFMNRYWYHPADAWMSFYIEENEVRVTVENVAPPEPCKIANLKVDGVTTESATLHYTAIVGANNSLTIYLDIDNAVPDNVFKTVHTYATVVSLETFYTYTGLENGKTYYVRARGVDRFLNPVWDGKWIEFTTKTEVEIIEKPPRFDLFRVKAGFASGLGISEEGAGILLSLLCMLVVLFPLVYIGAPHEGIVAVVIVLVGLFTALTWLPVWIALVVGLGFAILLAKELSGI